MCGGCYSKEWRQSQPRPEPTNPNRSPILRDIPIVALGNHKPGLWPTVLDAELREIAEEFGSGHDGTGEMELLA